MPKVELAACQIHVTIDDYGSADRFEAMLARVGRRLDAARERDERGRFARPCVAVFPEMIGAFLPLAGRAHLARGARTTDDALTRVALREAGALFGAMARHGAFSPKVAFLVAASPGVRRIYHDAFSRFAREHASWTIAGSALLPRNAEGDLAADFEPEDGRVYNTSYAFSPEGCLAGVTRKVHLVPTLEDTLGLTPARADELTPIETPFGRVGTLICYDGFRIPHTSGEPEFCPLVRRHDAARASIVAHPAANPWPWEERWFFADPGETQLRREQWMNEGIFAQLAEGSFSHVRYAITAHLLGQVIDNRFEGRSQILERGAGGTRILAEAARADGSPAAEEVVLAAVDLP